MTEQRAVIVRTSFMPYRNTQNHNADWQATLDNYEPGQPIGLGSLESEAVYNLYEEIALREEEEAERHDPKNV